MQSSLRPLSRCLNQPSRQSISRRRQFHKHYNAKLEEQKCKLSDGRDIGFAEYGVQDGIPTFFFHGAPGARFDGLGYDEPAKKLGVRIICPDRPGHGYSSPKPGRTLSEYAKDISELARHLKITQYHVFGQSGGGPYAVACAHSSPKDELLNATVVAGMGPPGVITRKDAGLYTVAALSLTANFPNAMRKLNDWFYPPSFWASDEKVGRSLKMMYRLLKEEDRKVMEKPEAQPEIIHVIRAAFAQGSGGTFGDNLIYYGPWDFELKDVMHKVTLIYGDKDDRTPLAFGRYYKKHLPHAELIELKDASHFTIEKYLDDILAKVVGKKTSKVMAEVGEIVPTSRVKDG